MKPVRDDRAPIDPAYRALGRRIQSLRAERKFSRQAFADHCGMSRMNLAHIEAGRQRVFVHILLAIARALRVKLQDLGVAA